MELVVVATNIFRVYAYDLNTNTLITELPASGLTFDSRLNDSGSISFTLNLSRPEVASRVKPLLPYNGNPFAVYVDRDGSIVWSGIIWTWNYSRKTGDLAMQGKEFMSYFAQRVLAAQYTNVEYPSGIDPAALVKQAVVDAQNNALAGPGSNIGIVVAGGTSTIPAIIPGYPSSQNTKVSQLVSDMAAISSPGNGTVDTTIASIWSAGAPLTTLTIWSPRAGRIGSASGLILDLSRALDYTWPTNATATGTKIIATGGNSLTTTIATGVPVGGLGQLPHLDKVVSFSSVQTQSQLDTMASGLAQVYDAPLPTPTVTIPTSALPQLGTFVIGDDIRMFISFDERFPAGLDEYWRIIQYSVTVPNEGVPTITFTLNPPPVY
jgi:hypothetical protein